MGGLGNQLFQYAYSRGLELSGKKIVFDTSFFEGAKAKEDSARDFKLNNFNIETKAKFENKRDNVAFFINKIKRRLGVDVEEYYQSEKYFKKIEKSIRREFALKNPISEISSKWKEKIGVVENSISVHIRRGDYVQNQNTNAFHGICDIEYYNEALKRVAEILNNKNIEVFVFSDDINWTKENIKFPYPVHFVSDQQIPDYEELILMSLCKHNIIANSTFSWWGAWLNKNQNKIVMAPKQWFVDKTTDELDILPSEWIKI